MKEPRAIIRYIEAQVKGLAISGSSSVRVVWLYCIYVCVYKRKVDEGTIEWVCQYVVLCVGRMSLEREKEPGSGWMSCRSMCDWEGLEETESGQGTEIISRKGGE